jgi:hypothetical protein
VRLRTEGPPIAELVLAKEFRHTCGFNTIETRVYRKRDSDSVLIEDFGKKLKLTCKIDCENHQQVKCCRDCYQAKVSGSQTRNWEAKRQKVFQSGTLKLAVSALKSFLFGEIEVQKVWPA